MALEPYIEELKIGENEDLINLFKKGQIGVAESVKLFELIFSLNERYGKKLKLRDALKNSFDFTDFDYKRLDADYHKWLKREKKKDSPSITPEGPAPPLIMDKAKQIGTGATKALLGEVQEIGNLLVMDYAQKAAMRGESLKDYVINCIQLREQFGDQIEALTQENMQYKTLCQMFAEVVKPTFKQLAVSRMYMDFITNLIQLNALGYNVKEKVIDDIEAMLKQTMGVSFSQ